MLRFIHHLFAVHRKISIFALQTPNNRYIMKYKEFHRKILASGWKFSHAEGNHYFYLKDGRLSEPVPYHGAKEIPEPLRRKIAKGMGVK